MNIKNMLCAVLMMSAAFGNSVAVAGTFETVRNAGKASMAFVIISTGVVTGGMCAGAIAIAGEAYYPNMTEALCLPIMMTGIVAGGEASCALANALLVEKTSDSNYKKKEALKEALDFMRKTNEVLYDKNKEAYDKHKEAYKKNMEALQKELEQIELKKIN
jgi:hypothetical protein